MIDLNSSNLLTTAASFLPFNLLTTADFLDIDQSTVKISSTSSRHVSSIGHEQAPVKEFLKERAFFSPLKGEKNAKPGF